MHLLTAYKWEQLKSAACLQYITMVEYNFAGVFGRRVQQLLDATTRRADETAHSRAESTKKATHNCNGRNSPSLNGNKPATQFEVSNKYHRAEGADCSACSVPKTQ